MKTDLLIIGGGPAGAACALEARRNGVEKVLLIDKAPFGRLKSCAGGLSPRAEKALIALDIWDDLKPHLYPISGARITAGEKAMEFSGKQSATVHHRADLDHYLLSQAKAAGVEIRYETRAEKLLYDDGRLSGVRTPSGELHSKLTVFAGGATGSLLKDSRKRRSLTSCTTWYEGAQFTPGHLEMVFPRELKPHYIWLFPEGPARVNVGMCLFPERLKGWKITDLFDDLVQRYFAEQLEGAAVIAGPLVHPLRPVRSFRNSTPTGGMVCGEEGGLINGFTGEGISLALESGMAAGRAAAEVLQKGQSADSRIRAYEKEVWKLSYGALLTGRILCGIGPPLLGLTSKLASSSRIRNLTTRLMSKA